MAQPKHERREQDRDHRRPPGAEDTAGETFHQVLDQVSPIDGLLPARDTGDQEDVGQDRRDEGLPGRSHESVRHRQPPHGQRQRVYAGQQCRAQR
jgi:hypothetical protein